jgi:myo-inositol-hexaphosphate 3-phosphohydrolase
MDQNIPNPFTDKTDISIYLPETVKSATLYIYDLSGKQLEQHAVEGRGETAMTIRADKMDAGMYIYSLIADGKVVTSKKMIVVK